MLSIPESRLRSQQIANSSLDSAAAVVSWMVSIQAQNYAGGKWSIGLRWPAGTEAAVEQALQQRQILRTWTLRGTLHFVAASDIGWLLALLAPRLITKNARRYRQLDLDEQTLACSSALLAETLQDGRARDRTALKKLLEAEGISMQGQRAPYILQHAALKGQIAQTTAPRNNPLYVSLADNLPQARALSREEALAELALRYFSSHGPATLQDFIWWSGLLAADARAGLTAVSNQLIKETIAGEAYWRTSQLPGSSFQEPVVCLHPPFDEFLLGYRERGAVLSEPQQTLWKSSNAMFPPTITVNGRVVGFWRRTQQSGEVIIRTENLSPTAVANPSDLQKAVRRYGDFLGLPARLS
jgi:hypothetical protein